MDHDMMHHDMMHHDHASMMAEADGGDTGHLLCHSDMGMIMYMDGFQWTLKGESSCLNFFFGSWTLNTIPKFVAAMVVVFAMGILTEYVNRWKHSVQQQISRPLAGNSSETSQIRWLHTGLQGLSILSAYLIMLVVMTYSLELLFCVIGGLMAGYYIFDGDELHHGGGTPCCNFLEGNSSEIDGSMAEALLPPSASREDVSGSTTNGNNATSNEHSCCNNNDRGVP